MGARAARAVENIREGFENVREAFENIREAFENVRESSRTLFENFDTTDIKISRMAEVFENILEDHLRRCLRRSSTAVSYGCALQGGC